MSLAPLFEPFRCGTLALRNRIVMAPMTRLKSPGQYPGPATAAYYRRRAENEVGLIITEGTTIDHPVASYSANVPAFHGEALTGWRRVCEVVHGAGGRIVPQLWHVGIMRDFHGSDYPAPHLPSASPSGVHGNGQLPVAAPSDPAELRAIAASFARAATAAREIGFDGVEIHGAHGYLLDQFLWDGTNQRQDGYGGDAGRRARFPAEIVAAVRSAVGPDFPIILRLSQWKLQDFDARLAATPEDLAALVRPLAEAGVDIFHASQRRFWDAEFEGSPLNLAGWIKALTGRPTMTVGSVGLARPSSAAEPVTDSAPNLEPLAARLAAGEFDLVAAGRALLSDAGWARKIREGSEALSPFDRARSASYE